MLDDLINAATAAALTQIGYELKEGGWQWGLPSHLKQHHHRSSLVHPKLPVK
jgi:hypothetical protein